MDSLQRHISLLSATAIAVGMVVGSGLYGLPGLALQMGPPQNAALGWLACAVFSFPLLCIFAFLGERFSSAGGLSSYAEATIGRTGAYAVSALLCGTFPLVVPAQAIIGASYALTALRLEQSMLLPISTAFVVACIGLNLSGARATAWVSCASLVVIVTTVIILGATHPSYVSHGMKLWAKPALSSVNFPLLWKTTALIFWAFLGWENVSFGLEEFKDPFKTIKRAYFFSFVVVLGLYCLLAATVNGASMSTPDVRVTEGLAVLVPPEWRTAFATTSFAVILAGGNAWVFGASRLYYSAARRGILPPIFAKVDAHGVPRNALLLLASCLLAVVAVAGAFRIETTSLVLLASQNFILMYLVCVYSFFRTARGFVRWALTLMAIGSCCLMLSGMSITLVYSMTLLVIGVWHERRVRHPRSHPHHWSGDG